MHYHLNGTSIYALKEGQGEPLVFMHGFGLDHRMWEKQTILLRNHFMVINYDLRGFGRSALPELQTPYSHEDDYIALLQLFGLQSAPIIGLSMGGRLALRCAITYPNAVSSLVLLDSAMDGHAWSVSWQDEWNNIVSAAKEDSLDTALDLWMGHRIFAYANTNPALSSALSTMVKKYSGWHWINKDPASVPRPLTIDRLGHIDIPTLAITGEYDIPDFQEIGDKISQAMPNAQRLVVPGAGHMVNMESPDAINKAILNFLSSRPTSYLGSL